MEVTLPAFLLARESGFFRAALTNGFKETHSRVISLEAAEVEGETEPADRVATTEAVDLSITHSLLLWQRRMISCSSSRFFTRARAT
jgi:hypothetical protein